MAAVKLEQASHPVENIFCIGRNYAAHAAEMGSAVETEPMVFLKPTSALLFQGQALRLPPHSRDVHHECELVALIGKGGDDIAEADALSHVAGYGIGLDLTARDVQARCKEKGHPWTLAKGFRGAACVSGFVAAQRVANPQRLAFSLKVNGAMRQQGDASQMVFPLAALIAYLSSVYGLSEGDLIFTGTPAGVGPLRVGDKLELSLDGLATANWEVAE